MAVSDDVFAALPVLTFSSIGAGDGFCELIFCLQTGQKW